jgi:hypothetical protein
MYSKRPISFITVEEMNPHLTPVQWRFRSLKHVNRRPILTLSVAFRRFDDENNSARSS